MESHDNPPNGAPSDQQEFGQYICERDGHTCQRCGVEQPDNGLAIARLEPLEAESDQENQTGERDPENHLMLCQPCLAVTRPNDEELNGYRLEVSLYPVDDVDPRIAYVNSQNPYETESAFADRILQGGWLSSTFGKECARCNDKFDVDELVVFPHTEPWGPSRLVNSARRSVGRAQE